MLDRLKVDGAEFARVLETFQGLVQAERDNDPSNPNLEGLESDLKALGQRWEQRRFRVAVVGLMKSGKSVFLNALLGDELLPSSNVAETARVVHILHDSGQDQPLLLQGKAQVAAGAGQVLAWLKDANHHARYTEAPMVPSGASDHELELSAGFACLAGDERQGLVLELLDTPGPNEAGAGYLRARVEAILQDAAVVLYLLDYTKLKTEEEDRLFERLRELRGELLKESNRRLFFVVNKMDQRDSRGLGPEETRDYVVGLLGQKFPTLNVQGDQVLLVSARQALLARLVLSGRADHGILRDFVEAAFGPLADDKSLEDCQALAPRLLEKSCLPKVEEAVLRRIAEDRASLFLQDLVDRLFENLNRFTNHVRTRQGALRQGVDEAEKEVHAIRARLSGVSSAIEELAQRMDRDAQDRLRQWVTGRFASFRCEITRQLDAAARGAERSEGDGGDYCTHSGQRSLPARSAARSGGDGGGVIAAIRRFFAGRSDSSDKDQCRRELEKAHRELSSAFQKEFEAFRADLEQEAYRQQEALFEELRQQTRPLCRRIEEVVGQSLQVSLEPARIRLDALTREAFHHGIQGQLDKLMKTREETRREQVSSGGWCSDPSYRTVTEVHYSVDPEAVRSYWNRQVEDMSRTSAATASNLVGREVERTVAKAKAELQRYRDGYTQATDTSLREARRGDEEHKLALEHVKVVLKNLERSREELQTLQAHLAGGLVLA